ncbi:MAG TPA: hypothetical protein VF727_16025 [Allosphingosinicella sp.]
MRKLILAASALAFAAPAFAQSYPDPRDEEIAEALPRGEELEEVGDTLGRVADALMDIDVGPLVDAVDPSHRGYRGRGRTLGDIAGRDDPYARERVRDEIRTATVGMAAAADEVAAVTPVLRRSLEDATRRVEDAIEDGRRAREWDRRRRD